MASSPAPAPSPACAASWLGTTPIPKQRIYYANHSSHGDFVLLWASLPPEVRRRTRPVAGADYWNKAGLRSYVINKVFNGVLVDRQRSEANANPLEPSTAPWTAAIR